jgi:hypothetical protein
MTSTRVHHIPLPNLDIPKLKTLIKEDRGTRLFEQNKFRSSDDVFRHVLKVLWDPVIDFLDIKVSSRSGYYLLDHQKKLTHLQLIVDIYEI